jgi:hypothetical protein
MLYVGDFNFKEIDWENNNTDVGPEHLASQFLESVRDKYLYQHVKHATRYRGDNQPSLLDLILTNEEEMSDNVVHNAPLGNSDHDILEFNYKLGRNENTRSNQQSLRFFKGNYDEINRLLANTDWNLELAQGDIDELWNRFADKISSTYKDNIPVSKSMTNKLNTPWMNEVTLNSLIKKRKLWTKFKYCKSPLNKSNYDEAKRSANYHVRQENMNLNAQSQQI